MSTSSTHSSESLNRRLFEMLSLATIDSRAYLELALWALFVLIGGITRFWDLGARGLSHDDSLHALYSWKLYRGEGYSHDPMMHGPFLYHINAFIYFLFGASDYTSRISVALFGTLLVASPYFLRKWLGRMGAILSSLMIALSPVLLHYSRHLRHDMFACVWTMLMVIALFKFIDERREGWLYVGAAALTLSLCTKETAYIFGFIGASFLVVVRIWEAIPPVQLKRVFGLMALVLVLLLVAAGFLQARGSVGPLSAVVLAAGFVAAMLVAVRLRGDGRPLTEALGAVRPRALLNCAIIAAILFSLLFTTFFTNPKGLITGVAGSVSYWLGQHDVQRGGQPWYYYILLLLPLYEFLPSLFALTGVVYWLFRGSRRASDSRDHKVKRLTIERGLFVSFLAYWAIMSILLFSWAGEKMPWLTTHLVLPLTLIAGGFVGGVIDSTDWMAIKRRQGWLVGLLVLPTMIALVTLLRIRPFRGMSLSKLNQTGQWLAALILAGLLLYVLALYMQRLGRQRSLRVLFITVFILLLLGTVRYSWLASFINYDYAKEFLFYAHATPDVKLVMAEIEELSRRTVGDREIKVAYDDDSTWPLEWYLRDYPNRAFYAAEPNREALDAPVVIVGSKNESKVRPFLGNRYHRFERRLVWWPIEDYKGLTPRGLWDIVSDPLQRRKWWDIILYRKYEQPTAQWSPSHIFYLYVRKDVTDTLWDYHVGPVITTPPEEEPYEKSRRSLVAIHTWGAQGSEPAQFEDPRGIAVGPEGKLYVTDGSNHRVQVFDDGGEYLHQWGSQGSGPGQFQEPWGLTVAPDGDVYVADTWNHRIQVFGPDGTFKREWGTFAQMGQALEADGQFWGPRDVAVDANGDVYVTDTGNKRVQKFSADGAFVGQWGGLGIQAGQMDEPVGISVSAAGRILVADTWNQRVQKFDQHFVSLAQWGVEAWFGQSVLNKPYVATDSQERVYVTDPEGYQVIVFTADGELVATFGRYGNDSESFALPIGIDIGSDDRVYVVDSGNHRVMQFAPLGE